MQTHPQIATLRAPLSADEIEWKIVSAKDGVTSVAPYIDARAVMDRLDRAFTPFGWSVRYTPGQVGQEYGVIAAIAVKDPATGEWIEKQDGSGPSDIEPFKGGISGALKRAATAWGIGRELYTYPRVFIEGEHKKWIPFKVLDRLKGLPGAVAQGKSLPAVIQLNAEGEQWNRPPRSTNTPEAAPAARIPANGPAAEIKKPGVQGVTPRAPTSRY